MSLPRVWSGPYGHVVALSCCRRITMLLNGWLTSESEAWLPVASTFPAACAADAATIARIMQSNFIIPSIPR